MFPSEAPVVLFDGMCNLCDALVQFLIANDPGARLRYTAQQSPAGEALLRAHGIEPGSLDAVAFAVGGKLLVGSDAALAIVPYLRAPWPLFGALRFVPHRLRDIVYAWIARNRYRWFGKRTSCAVPTPELLARFL